MDRILRPTATVLPDAALIPEANLLVGPPEHFTHVVEAAQSYRYRRDSPAADGTFAAGAQVALLERDTGGSCRVVDGRGLSVWTAFEGLKPRE